MHYYVPDGDGYSTHKGYSVIFEPGIESRAPFTVKRFKEEAHAAAFAAFLNGGMANVGLTGVETLLGLAVQQ